jgi:hypothetical protein
VSSLLRSGIIVFEKINEKLNNTRKTSEKGLNKYENYEQEEENQGQ